MASTKGQKTKNADEKPLNKYKKPLPVALTTEELLAKSKAAGKLAAKIEKKEDEKSTANAERKTEIDELKLQLKKLHHECATGEEEREVEVLDIPNYAENVVEIVRSSDMVIMDTRTMAATERQGTLAPKSKKDDKDKN